MGNVIASQSNQLLSVSSPTSSLISTQRKPGTAPFMQRVVLPMLVSSTAENSHRNLPRLTSHLKPSSLQPQSSSSHHMKMRNLPQFSSQLLKQTCSAKALPFNLPPLQARQLVQSQHSSSFSEVLTLQTGRNHSSQPWMTLPSHSPEVSSFLPFAKPLAMPVTIHPSLLATVSVKEVLQQLPLLVAPTTRSNY